ncbi:MAG: hypothetical protein M0R06_00115 [Sphaerochaeta sp.]|jgi:hypothetical protein|nr:hypothetical protein [Sphaerochaeta sp.]
MPITFPTTLDSFSAKVDNTTAIEAVNINDVQSAIEALEAKVGINSSLVSASLDYKVNNFFVAGRILWLYEDTAPTGWTYVAAITDTVLAVKGGAQAYNVAGGNPDGVASWTGPDCILTAAQMAHNHQFYNFVAADSDAQVYDTDGVEKDMTQDVAAGSAAQMAVTTSSIYVNRALNFDGFTKDINKVLSPTAHNHGSTYRPKASVGILVEKD